jgi:hypothetical protein
VGDARHAEGHGPRPAHAAHRAARHHAHTAPRRPDPHLRR